MKTVWVGGNITIVWIAKYIEKRPVNYICASNTFYRWSRKIRYTVAHSSTNICGSILQSVNSFFPLPLTLFFCTIQIYKTLHMTRAAVKVVEETFQISPQPNISTTVRSPLTIAVNELIIWFKRTCCLTLSLTRTPTNANAAKYDKRI